MTVSLDQGLNAFVDKIDAPIASFFNSCVHCGMCADACLFYTETSDPKYTPIYKLEPLRRVWKREFTFWGKLAATFGISKPITDQELEDWEVLIYDSCTMCGRCSVVCPVGNDIAYMIRKVREGMVASGHAPEGLKGSTERSVSHGSAMGNILKTLQVHIRHAEEETGLEIPIDVVGADYLVLMSASEIAGYPEIISAMARIFRHAGVSWTFCSTAYDATNPGLQIGSSDMAKLIVQRTVTAAEQLQVKAVISPECGHAYTALRWEGPNLIGRNYPFQVIHILELLDELRQQGRLRTEGMEEERLTFHDPCQLVRRGGIKEQPRNLLNMVARNFVEMEDAGLMNWCCGGGGGVGANERADPLRLKVFSRKKKQIDALNVNTLVTACSNCRDMLSDGIEEYGMSVEVVSLVETIAAHLLEEDNMAAANAENTK
jgi:Fe-S oxidoreductase